MTVHIPVLINEVTESLNLKPGMTVVDATLGGGGYTLAIAKKIGNQGKVIAIDRDREALDRFKQKIGIDPARDQLAKIELIHGSFGKLEHLLKNIEIERVDAVVADLGLSSDQLAGVSRGFSFQSDGPLDMRMDQNQTLTAGYIVNDWTESELERIFREYGEERLAKKISKEIVKKRQQGLIKSTKELAAIASAAYPKGGYARINPATRIFQALRMAVNDEMNELEQFLKSATKYLKKNGRMAIVTFHSGEDRMVKQWFRENSQNCICPPGFPVCQCDHRKILKVITKKPIISSEIEVEKNPRARSAKLRVAEKV